MRALILSTLFTWAAVAAPPPYQRGTLSTNGALQDALMSGLIIVDPVNGSDSAPYPGPWASMPYADSNANAGSTVFVASGTHNLGAYGLTNVLIWEFAEGVVVTNGFFSTYTNLRVSGRAEWLGSAFLSVVGTNQNVKVELKRASVDTLVSYGNGGNSNAVSISGDVLRGGLQFQSYTLTNVSWTILSARDHLGWQIGVAAVNAGSVTNRKVFFRCPMTISNEVASVYSTKSGSFYFEGARLWKGGSFIASGEATNKRWFFNNCWLHSSNDVPGGTSATNVYGQFNIYP